MAGTNSNQTDPRPCEMCSSIPSDLWANTGRGESLYPEIEPLVRLDLDTRNDLYACPGCEALFEWSDLSQLSGSGNNDEERLTRLTPEQAAIARALLDPDPGERDGEQLLERAFRVLSHEIVCNILSYRAGRRKEAFAALVGPLVARLMSKSGAGLFDVIRKYCGYDRERLAEVLRLLDAGGPDASRSAQYLRESCAERLEQANRFRPK
jgi:hypothetical protein